MKISYNWLKEFLPDLTASPAEIAELLTMRSFETEVASARTIDPAVTVVRIEKIAPHPHADRLRLATITDGIQTVTVVCGASNISAGDIVPYAPPSAKLLDEDGRQFKVKQATIRQVPSPGMLNSLRELGLGKDHIGIFLLPPDTPIGSKLADHIPDDAILEADITPNRAHDCLSHRGIAREIAALLKHRIIEPKMPKLPEPELGDWAVAIENETDTPRYLGALLQNISIGPSPLWLIARLLAIGVKPINNIVDITNYVMFELGNPTHAFDSDKLLSHDIAIRKARAGETITTLDEAQHSLTDDMLVITSGDTPVAIAGIMGGQGSEVGPDTTAIFLEVANFNGYAVQRTAAKLNLQTEASTRFSKGLDPNLVFEAAARCVGLLQEIAGAKLVGILDQYPKPVLPRTIAYSPDRPTQLAGVKILPDVSGDVLARLRCRVAPERTPWQVTAPTDRLDLTGEHDLAEEVIRVHGLEKIPAKRPKNPRPKPLPAAVAWRESIRDALVIFGMTETYNYSFEREEAAAALSYAQRPHLTLANPIAPELKHLRTSLLPGLLRAIAKNKAHARTQYMFEIGHTYRASDDATVQVPGVQEIEQLAGIIAGEGNASDLIQNILSALFEHAGMPDARIDTFGEIVIPPRRTLKALKLNMPLAAFELNLEKLIAEATGPPRYVLTALGEPIQYQPFSKYPSVFRDVSAVVDPAVQIETVQGVIEQAGGSLVTDVDLFDVYDAALDPADQKPQQKSLAFHIRYQAPDRTLTDEEVNQVHGKIMWALKEELDAQIR